MFVVKPIVIQINGQVYGSINYGIGQKDNGKTYTLYIITAHLV